MELAHKLRNLGKIRQYDKIEKLLSGTSAKDIIEVLEANIQCNDANTLWSYILLGFHNGERNGDLFKIVLAALNQLNKVDVSHKHCFDLVIRMFGELPKFSGSQLIELVEFCTDSIRLSDPKCIGWKDLLPEVMKLLGKHTSLSVNGFPMSGVAYREMVVRQICTMRWVSTTLTPITMMFREIPTSKEEKSQILTKVCDHLDLLEPTELPPLANQLFLLANTASLIMIPIYGLNRFFTKHYYALDSMDSDASDFDSIEKYSPKEMQEAQETILYHLSKASEFRVDERDIVNFCKTIAASPRCILAPFFVCALLSMSNINRYPESVLLSSSLILPFLRSIIRGNDAEMEMCAKSAWSRDTLDRKSVDLVKLLSVLTEQSKDGMEIVTPGLVWLAFAMLKTTGSPTLHHSATCFLEKFVKRRFIFGQGIVKNLVNFQLAELDAVQYSDCLTRLSMTSAYAVSESMDTIHRVLDYLLLVPGAQAMRMMSFIIPLIKSSQKIRDLLIEMLRKAMVGRESSTRQMGVYGFCLVLKHLRENNSRRATGSSASQQHNTLSGSGRFGMMFSQHSISGYSLMSQTILDTDQNPQRHFDMLALEIIGMLRKCFNQTYEVKEVLYEGLGRAIDFNPKLTPHIIQFLESHLQKYVVVTDATFELRIRDVVREANGTLSVWDHLGQLVQLMGHCVVVCKQKGVVHDNRAMTGLLDTMIMRIDGITLEDLGLAEHMDMRLMHIGSQYLNCLEALMGYAIWSMSEESANMSLILKLYKHHRRTNDSMIASNVRKRAKKDKNATSRTLSADRPTIVYNPVNIWDLSTIMRFLSVVFSPDVPFATAEQTEPLRTNVKFVTYLLGVVVARMQALPAQAEARHFKHSQSTFVQLGQITRIIYRQCVAQLAELSQRLDVHAAQLSVECFEQCLKVALHLYPRKDHLFLQSLTMETTTITKNINTILVELQRAFEQFLGKRIGADGEEDDTKHRVPQVLLQCIEILLDHMPATDEYAAEVFAWLYKMCTEHEIEAPLIHKLLFVQRVRTNTGSFFESIAMQIEQLVAHEEEPPTTKPTFVLKSLTTDTMESCLQYLCATLKAQIDDVEYFITKSKSFLAKMRIIAPSSIDSCVQDIRSTERLVCSQLVLIAQTVLPLTHIGIPSGQCSDGVVKILNQLYVCLSNLTKHLIVRHTTIPVVYSSIRFDKLVRLVGRPLAKRIYELIEHIENSVFADEKYTNNPTADRAKVLRATRLLPKLVLNIENFNKFVLLLGKKTKHDLADHLHMGTVRDFKISKSALREVIEQANGDETTMMEADEDAEWHDSEEEASCMEASKSPDEPSPVESQLNATADVTSSGTLVELKNVDISRPDRALKNLAMMNARIKRKRKDEPEKQEPIEENLPHGPKPKKRKKPRVPQVINKESLQKTRRSTRNNSVETT